VHRQSNASRPAARVPAKARVQDYLPLPLGRKDDSWGTPGEPRRTCRLGAESGCAVVEGRLDLAAPEIVLDAAAVALEMTQCPLERAQRSTKVCRFKRVSPKPAKSRPFSFDMAADLGDALLGILQIVSAE
jgi:hypothetical protein